MSLLAAVLLVVFTIAVLAGLRFGRTWTRFYLLLAVGLGLQAAVGAALVVREPTGDGWSGRSEVLGHWVPTAQIDAAALAVLPWMIGLAVAAFASVVSRTDAPADVNS